MLQSFEVYQEEKEIISSLRFYFMLGITLSSGGESQLSCKSLNQFMVDLKFVYSEQKIKQFTKKAVMSFPSEFTAIYSIPAELRR